ncbi:MAG: symmetrical bis(5'-nucleosyl)-tetraphosphatase [Pseudomonadota bacterium]|nr:symmetrical bis(5'-nucleosyl)-tetraphosphatase [Pseudomonadota bacterium]
MAIFAVGDIQGCFDELQQLIDTIKFDPTKDKLWFVGDLVNRGPKSLQTLQFIRNLNNSAVCVLGNHDLHLIAIALTGKYSNQDDSLIQILEDAACGDLIEWLRHQPLTHYDKDQNILMVHAGVIPNWSIKEVLSYGKEVEEVLRGKNANKFLKEMYGNTPDLWSKNLTGNDRLRFITNSLTRIRFCTPKGKLELETKHEPSKKFGNYLPWYEIPERKIFDTKIVFGHWSSLGLINKPNLLALDTGCVWGGTLTAVQINEESTVFEVPSQQPKKF